jgi:hypothetical protein
MTKFIHIHVGGSHAEELALEQFAVSELEHEANAHWQAGRFAAANEARRQLTEARARVRELEQQDPRA